MSGFGLRPSAFAGNPGAGSTGTPLVFGQQTGIGAPGTSVFGVAQSVAMPSTIFGQPTALPTTTPAPGVFQTGVGSLFNTGGSQSQGTPMSFKPTEHFDAIQGSAVRTNAKIVCITAMREYEMYSFEELRLADYQLNRRFKPQTQGLGVFPANNSLTTPLGGGIGIGQSTPTSTSQAGNFFNIWANKGTGGTTNTGFPAGNIFGGQTGTSTPAPVTPSFGFGNNNLSGTSANTTFGSFGTPSVGLNPSIGATPATNPSTFTFSNLTQQVGASNSGPTQTVSQSIFTSSVAATNIGFRTTTPLTSSSTFGFGANTNPTPSVGMLGTQPQGFPQMPYYGTPALWRGTCFYPQIPPGTYPYPGCFPHSAVPQTGPIPYGIPPFRHSALFYNLITDRDVNQMSRPTSVEAQMRFLESSQRSSNLNNMPVRNPYTSPRGVPNNQNYKSLPLSVFMGTSPDYRKVDILAERSSVKRLPIDVVRKLSSKSPGQKRSFLNNNNYTGGVEDQNQPFEQRPLLPNPNAAHIKATFKQLVLERSFSDDDEPVEQSVGAEASQARSTESKANLPNFQSNNPQGDTFGPYKYDLTDDEDDDDKLEQRRKSPSPTPAEPPYKSGVILTRIGYYTKPSLSELDWATKADGTCQVSDFVIGRTGYGEIRFLEPVNLSGLNLDDLIIFRHKEVTIYPDDKLKPEPGNEINVPVEIQLERMWPTDPKTCEPIKTSSELRRVKFEDRLKRSVAKMGDHAQFISYDEETGTWLFRLGHF